MLHRLQPELGGLDAQGGVVRHDDGAAVHRLPERGGQDAVVVLGGVEAVLADLVQVEAVGLDAQRAAVGQRHRRADVTVVGDPQLLDGADHRAGRPPDIVHPALVLVELLHHDQRDHRIGAGEGVDAVRIGDEHRRVEHHPGGGGWLGRAGARLVGEEIGQGAPKGSKEGGWAGGTRAGGSPRRPATAGAQPPLRFGEPAGSPPLSEPTDHAWWGMVLSPGRRRRPGRRRSARDPVRDRAVVLGLPAGVVDLLAELVEPLVVRGVAHAQRTRRRPDRTSGGYRSHGSAPASRPLGSGCVRAKADSTAAADSAVSNESSADCW